MKKKILVLVLLALPLIIWHVLADKFEHTVRTVYIPVFENFKEKGWLSFDSDSIKIEKYKFKVSADNVSYAMLDNKMKVDQLAACYNPINDNVNIYSVGEKLFMTNSGLETYISNPNLNIVVNRKALEGDFDKIKLSLLLKKHELLSTMDNSLLYKSGDNTINLTSELNKTSNQYDIKFQVKQDDLNLTTKYFQDYSTIFENTLKVEDPKINKKFTELSKAYLEYCSNILNITNPLEYKADLNISIDKKHLDSIYQLLNNKIKLEIELKDLFKDFDFANEPLKVSLDIETKDNISNNQFVVNFSNDKTDLRTETNFTGNYSYSKEQEMILAEVISKLMAKVYDIVGDGNRAAVEDFNLLSRYITDIKDINFGVKWDYNIVSSDFNGNLNVKINDHKGFLNAQKKQNLYSGNLNLSDPATLIAAKTKITQEVIIPVYSKTTQLADNQQLLKLEKANNNLKLNGFEALKALSDNQNLKIGDEFNASFTFDMDKFEFKLNDKPFLKIITDERIVNFLKGFEEADEKTEIEVKAPEDEVISKVQENEL